MINQAGLDLIKSFECCRLEAYPDPGTGGEPWTVGWGHTGPEVHKGLLISQEDADRLLLKDLEKVCTAVDDLLEVDVTENQFAALVSFAYNCGIGNLKQSLLLRCVNKNNFNDAAAQFLRWNKAAGRVLPGLTRRREAERKLFLS